MAVNAHRALYSASSQSNYLAALNVDDDDEDELRKARDDIRDALKQGFQDWQTVIEKRQLFEDSALASVEFERLQALRPKFRMQGSWSYHTLNRTTIEPPQEIDLDDGVFLPTSFLTGNGTTHPAIVSDSYFSAVEAILKPLCDKRGWKLGEPKPSCVRVIISDGAHVDLALYAIPDDEYHGLLEKALRRATASFGAQILDEAEQFNRDIYPSLPADHIMLAHRNEGWKPSDPRKLEDWFNAAIAIHGPQLRRVCRYFKGWRDNRWEGCRLSSIALMACAVTAYEQALAKPPENRDDLALLMVAKAMPTLLADAIANPVVDGQLLDEGWTNECRADFIAAAGSLRDTLADALAKGTAAQVIATLRDGLGHYVPNDAGLIDMTMTDGPAILTSGLLGQLADEPDARQAVKLGGDGRYG